MEENKEIQETEISNEEQTAKTLSLKKNLRKNPLFKKKKNLKENQEEEKLKQLNPLNPNGKNKLFKSAE